MKNLVWCFLIACLALVAPAHAQKTVYVHSVSGWTPDLFWNMTLVPDFSRQITISQKSHLFVTGHIDAKHTGIAGTATKSVGIAFEVRIDGSTVPGSVTGEDVTNVNSDPYYSAQIHAYTVLDPGTYLIEVFGRSYSSAAPNVDGLAEVKDGYNQVLFIVEPF